MASPLSWFSKLRFVQALAVAIVWPLALLVVAIAVVLVNLSPHLASGDTYSVAVEGGFLLAVVLLGPLLLILGVWAIARWRRGGAT